MTAAAAMFGGAGDWGLNMAQAPDATRREGFGSIVGVTNLFFGGQELIYGKATAAIRQFGLVTIGGAAVGNLIETQFTEIANTANTGAPVGVALFSMAAGDFGWVVVSGCTPINANASIAAGATFGIAAAGQAGANSAGKQILGAIGVAPSSFTVAKTAVTANAGSTRLLVGNTAGWFPGVYLSGTGIAAGTTVLSIDPDGRGVTISAPTSAVVNGTVTATYNNATIHYPIVRLQRSAAQGAIT